MIRIKNLKISVKENQGVALLKKITKELRTTPTNYEIKKRSIDARDKSDIFYVYDIFADVIGEEKILKHNKKLEQVIPKKYVFPFQTKEQVSPKIVVVGSGPAGLFCAYHLAEQNLNPIIIERGECIEKRVATVEKFWMTNELNENSNVQFGEGGAGTFSDGKLNTLVKDKNLRGTRVLELFVKFGASKEILYDSHPHIGTDILRNVVKNMREEIISLGGKFYFDTKLTNIKIKNNKVSDIELNHNTWLKTDYLVLAIGHSARDTFEMLYEKNIPMHSKPFAVGVRIEHEKELIDNSQYGDLKRYLPPASYKLTYQTKEKRGVYTFCMCPGGFVVNSSSEKNRLVINGMSNYKRESSSSNSAVIVTISPKDFGDRPLDGMYYQRTLEEQAYKIKNGKIPSQRLIDFYKNVETKEFPKFKGSHKGLTSGANLNLILPSIITDAIKEALPEFGKKIKGFDNDDAILSGIETRSSSPVRIERNEDCVSLIDNLYPCGEGAGYAGGITSSAMDGIKVSECLVKNIIDSNRGY